MYVCGGGGGGGALRRSNTLQMRSYSSISVMNRSLPYCLKKSDFASKPAGWKRCALKLKSSCPVPPARH